MFSFSIIVILFPSKALAFHFISSHPIFSCVSVTGFWKRWRQAKMIIPQGSCLIEDPITLEKWSLFCNGWLNPEPGATTLTML